MKGKGGSDPTLMVAIFAAALLLAAWRTASSIHLDLATAGASAAPLALGAVAVASSLATQRLHATRRTLASRQAVAVIPADEFDAKPEAVARLAAQLTRAGERSIAAWPDRRASALRIRLASDSDGRLLYLLEAPARSLGRVQTALAGFDGVELRPAAEVLGPQEGGGEVVRTELVLARPSVEPLSRPDLNPDPLQPFAAACAALGKGERLDVCIDLLATRGRRGQRLRRRLRRQAARTEGAGEDWLNRLGGQRRGPRGPSPDRLIERRRAVQALDAKLRDSGPLFEAQILLRSEAGHRERAKAGMLGLLAAFEPSADRNWLRASGLPVPGLAFLGSDIPFRRGSFDRRFSSGMFRPVRQNVLTAAELAGFLKPPNVNCRSANVLRSGALLSPAPPLPRFTPEREDLIPLGRVRAEDGEQIVGVRAQESFFSYIAGRSRYGKTELAIAQFVHLVRSGNGGFFLDPHGDALERIQPYLAEPALAERVVRIDLGPGSSSAKQPGWNLFELRGASAEEAEGRVEAVVDAFASALEWGERSTRAINLTTQAAAALARIAPVLPAEIAPTIFQIPALLTDERWRAAVLPHLPRAAQQFWTERFGRLAGEAITPLTNMVDRLRASTAAAVLLGQSESTYRVREAMEQRKIVLFCPGAGGTRDRLIANLAIFNLLHAAKGRAELPPEKRAPFWVFCDEIQSFDGSGSGNLAALLEQSAKFGLRAVLLNQNPERLSPATLNALTTNRSHLISTALNSHAAALLTREWGGEPSANALSKLERFRFIAQVTHEGSLSKPFALAGIRVEDVFGPRQAAPGVNAEYERSKFEVTRSPDEVLAHLETLDDRIYDALQAARRPSPREPRAGEQVRVRRSEP